MDNYNEFENLYKRLDNYLKRITGIHSDKSMVFYLEFVLPAKESSWLTTLRQYRNFHAHNEQVKGINAPVPSEWLEWLQETLDYCEKHEKELVPKLIKAYEKYKHKYNNKNTNKTTNSQIAQVTVKPLSGAKVSPKPSQGTKAPVKPSQSAGKSNSSNKKNSRETLANYVNSKAGIIQNRINHLDQEFKSKGIPLNIRDRIENSANSYLVNLRSAHTLEEAEIVFKGYQLAFGNDVSNHPIVRKEQLKQYKESHISAMNERISQLQPEAVPTARSYIEQLKNAGTKEEAEKIFETFKKFAKKTAVKKTATIGTHQNDVTFGNGTQSVPQQSSAPSSANPYDSTSSERQPSKLRRALVIALPIVLTVALAVGITCLCLFANWTVWQHVIGVTSGLLLLGLGALLAKFSHKKFGWGEHVVPFFIAAIAAITNFVLLCVYTTRYCYIFIWLATCAIISEVVITVVAFAKGGSKVWKILTLSALGVAVLMLGIGLLIWLLSR